MKSRTESSARRTGRLRAFVTIVLTIEMCPDVWADEASDIRAGQELASKVCSPCHVVAERPGPTFAEVAKGGHAARCLAGPRRLSDLEGQGSRTPRKVESASGPHRGGGHGDPV
jgi:hypothetical protein